MSHRFLIYSATLLVFLFSVSARSQEPATERSDKRTATREKAIDLLSSVAGQVDTLRSAQNRARIGSTTADLLWDVDEPRARRLFAAVAEDIKLGFSEPMVLPDWDPYRYMRTQPPAIFAQLRSNTIERIARHDPQLALEFLRTTRPVNDDGTEDVTPSETVLELRLAAQIAAKSPQLALELGRKSLADGFTFELTNVLTQLRSGDKAVWQGFYKEVFDKLKAADFAEDGMAEAFAVDLAQSFPPPQADEALYRDLLGMLVADALAEGCGGGPTDENRYINICQKIGTLFDKVVRYYPARAGAFRSWAQQAAEQDLWMQVYKTVDQGSVDDALAEATKHPDLSDRILWMAMVKATSTGKFDRAGEILQKTTSEGLRANMLEHMKYVQSLHAETVKRSARSGEPLVNGNEERVELLVENATRIAKTDRKAALEQLDQAGQIIESFSAGKSKLEGQIGLAILYSSLQSDRGFTIVESLMPRLNELIAAAAALDGFETHYLTDGEWSMTGQGSVGSLTTVLAQNAGFFSRLDFDRSLNLVNQLERPEIRLMAQLMMAQGVLSDRSAGLRTLPRN